MFLKHHSWDMGDVLCNMLEDFSIFKAVKHLYKLILTVSCLAKYLFNRRLKFE